MIRGSRAVGAPGTAHAARRAERLGKVMAMKRSGRACGMVVGVALLSAACGPASEGEVDVGDPGLETMEGPGSGDTNGAEKLAWHTWKSAVVLALYSPLLQDGAIHPSIVATGIFADQAGEEIFDHAFRCAVEDGTVVTYNDRPYEGLGMVTGASVWTAQGLSPSVADNVLECVIAFVNDKTEGVPVQLTGPNVNDDGEDHSDFIHREAVWCAHGATAGAVDVDVYPTRQFASECSLDPQAALEQRYCYQVGTCGLTYKGFAAFKAECQLVGPSGSGQYECNGKACTMTWLKQGDPDWCQPLPGSAP